MKWLDSKRRRKLRRRPPQLVVKRQLIKPHQETEIRNDEGWYHP